MNDEEFKKNLERLKKLGKKHKKIVASKEFQEGLKFFDPKVIAYTKTQIKLFKSKDIAVIFNRIAYFTLSNKCIQRSPFFLKTYCTITKEKIRSVKFKMSNLSEEYDISVQYAYRIIEKLKNADIVLVEREGTVYNVGINIDNYMGILLCTYIYKHWCQDVFPKNWKREFGLPKLV